MTLFIFTAYSYWVSRSEFHTPLRALNSRIRKINRKVPSFHIEMILIYISRTQLLTASAAHFDRLFQTATGCPSPGIIKNRGWQPYPHRAERQGHFFQPAAFRIGPLNALSSDRRRLVSTLYAGWFEIRQASLLSLPPLIWLHDNDGPPQRPMIWRYFFAHFRYYWLPLAAFHYVTSD